jgi:hypothetical protein
VTRERQPRSPTIPGLRSSASMRSVLPRNEQPH